MEHRAASPPRRGDPSAGRIGRVGPILVALILAATACEKASELPPGLLTPGVDSVLRRLPSDAWAVVGIDVARVRRVAGLERITARLPVPPLLPAMTGPCGVSAIGRVDLAVATLGAAAGGGPALVALRGSFTRDSIARCLAELPASERILVAEDGPLTVYRPRTGGGSSYVHWPAPDLLVTAPHSDRETAALGRLVRADGLGRSPALMALLGRIRTDAALWAVGVLPAATQAKMAALGPGVAGVRGFFAAVDGDPGAAPDAPVRALLGLRLAGEDEAKAAADALRDQRPALAAAVADARAALLVRRLEVGRSGADVLVHLSLSAAEIDMLVDMIAGASGP